MSAVSWSSTRSARATSDGAPSTISVVAVRADRHAELRLERFEILVVGAEERFDALFGDRNPARRRSGYCLGLLGVQL